MSQWSNKTFLPQEGKKKKKKHLPVRNSKNKDVE